QRVRRHHRGALTVRRGDGDLMVLAEEFVEPFERVETTGELPPGRIRPRTMQTADVVDIVGAAIGSFCLAWLIYELLTPLSGGLGFFIAWYGLFLAMVWFLARERVGKLQARDRLVGVVVATVGIGILIPLAIIVGYTITRGFHAMRVAFFTKDL